MGNNGGGYAESRWTLIKWVLSLLRELLSDSVVLTCLGSSFHHCSAKTQKSCDYFRVEDLFLIIAMAVPNVQLRLFSRLLELGVWLKLGCRQEQFHWPPCRPVPSSWIWYHLLQGASRGHSKGGLHGRILVGWTPGQLQCAQNAQRRIHKCILWFTGEQTSVNWFVYKCNNIQMHIWDTPDVAGFTNAFFSTRNSL